jgi:hypothetical protein
VLKVETAGPPLPVKGRPLIELTVRVLKVETAGPPLPVKGRPLIELTTKVEARRSLKLESPGGRSLIVLM